MPKPRRAQFKNYDDPLGPRFEGHFVEGRPTGGNRLKVVTYNVCQGRNVEAAIVELRTSEPLQGADIILLQEMDEAGSEQVARELGHNYVYYPASVPFLQGRNLGNAILARWTLTQPHKLILPCRHPAVRQTRIAVRATVPIGNRDVVVYSVHMEVYFTSIKHKKAQVRALVEDIGSGGGPVILGGDFNTITGRGIKGISGQFAQNWLPCWSRWSRPVASAYGWLWGISACGC